ALTNGDSSRSVRSADVWTHLQRQDRAPSREVVRTTLSRLASPRAYAQPPLKRVGPGSYAVSEIGSAEQRLVRDDVVAAVRAFCASSDREFGVRELWEEMCREGTAVRQRQLHYWLG